MKKIIILLIILAALCHPNLYSNSSVKNTSYYMTMDPGFSCPSFLFIKKDTHSYMRWSFGYNNLEIGNWTINKDTLFLIPQYIIRQSEEFSHSIKLYDYTTFTSENEALTGAEWRFNNTYIIRNNGLYEEREITTPSTQILQKTTVTNPSSQSPHYYRIIIKNNRQYKKMAKTISKQKTK